MAMIGGLHFFNPFGNVKLKASRPCFMAALQGAGYGSTVLFAMLRFGFIISS